MNPNLEYAQAIHGRFTGRGTGIIDTIHLVEVARAIEVLAPACRKRDFDAIKKWFAELHRVDDDASLRYRRARRDQQSRHLLGDASGRVRAFDGR